MELLERQTSQMVFPACRNCGLEEDTRVETLTHMSPCSVLSTGLQHNLSKLSSPVACCAWVSETPWCDEL